MRKDNAITFIEMTKQFFPPHEVRTVFEMGAKDCEDTLKFRTAFPLSNIYTFECNSQTIPLCLNRIKDDPKIQLTESAVSDIDGTITFYPIDTEKTRTTHKDGNPGASSIFRASGKYPVKNYVQKETKVPSTRLDTFMEKHNLGGIDVLWLDAQGAELKILQGLGKKIRTVRIINTEVEFIDIYKDQPLFKDIKKILRKNGFVFYDFTYKGRYFADAVFVNKDLVPGIFGLQRRLLKNWVKKKLHAQKSNHTQA